MWRECSEGDVDGATELIEETLRESEIPVSIENVVWLLLDVEGLVPASRSVLGRSLFKVPNEVTLVVDANMG